MFDPGLTAEARLTALRCPTIVTPADEEQIRVTFRNTLDDRDLRLFVITRISEGRLTMMRQINTQLRLAPGERETLTWDIAPEDAVYGRVIMARVHQFRSFPFPSRERSCGVLYLNIPWLTGGQVFWLLGGLTLLSLGSGAGLWLRQQQRPFDEAQRRKIVGMGVLTGILFIAFLAGQLGVWLVSLGLLIGVLLLAVSSLEGWSQR